MKCGSGGGYKKTYFKLKAVVNATVARLFFCCLSSPPLKSLTSLRCSSVDLPFLPGFYLCEPCQIYISFYLLGSSHFCSIYADVRFMLGVMLGKKGTSISSLHQQLKATTVKAGTQNIVLDIPFEDASFTGAVCFPMLTGFIVD